MIRINIEKLVSNLKTIPHPQPFPQNQTPTAALYVAAFAQYAAYVLRLALRPLGAVN